MLRGSSQQRHRRLLPEMPRRADLPLSQHAGVGRDRLTVALHGLNEGEVSRLMQVIEALDG